MMWSEVKSTCCWEVPAAFSKRGEQEGLQCVTQHSEFAVVCLQKSVLEVALLSFEEFRARCGPWSNR